MLRLGIVLVVVLFLHIASRCRGQQVCLHSLQAPGITLNPDSVTSAPHLAQTPSVV